MARSAKDKVTRNTATFFVALLFVALLWLLTGLKDVWNWAGFAGLIVCLSCLRHMSNGNMLMRLHTWMVPTLLVLLFGCMKEYHRLDWFYPAVCFYALSLFQLLRSYLAEHAERKLFASLFFLGVASLFYPPLIYVFPLYLISLSASLGCWSLRSLMASLIGLVTALEMGAAVVYLMDMPELAERYVQMLLTLDPVAIMDWDVCHMAGFLLTLLLMGLGYIHYKECSLDDRIRVRLCYSVLFLQSMGMLALTIAMPCYGHTGLPLLMLVVCPLAGHYLVFSKGWFANVMALFVLLLFLLLAFLNFHG